MIESKFLLKHRLFVFLAILICNLAVGNTFAQNLSVINLVKKQVSINGIISLKEAVVLDANKDCFFGEITCLLSSGLGFYILDERQSKAIFKFDRKGKFCFKFGSLGKGPGEYVNPVWIAVDESVNQLAVFDPAGHKLLIYNSKTSSFIKEIKIEFNARSFEFLKDNEGFIFYTCFAFNGIPVKSALIAENTGYQFIITDQAGTVKSLQVPYPDTFNPQNFIGMQEAFSSFGKVTSFYTQYNDTLYAMSPGRKTKPAFLIDYGNANQKLSTAFINTIGPLPTDFKRNTQLRSDSGIYHLYSQLQTDTHIQLTGIRNKSLFNYLVDKKSLNVLDLVKNKQSLNFGFRASDEKYYYSMAFIEAFHLPGDPSFNEYPLLLKAALKTAAISNNPVVLIWETSSF